MGKDLIQKSLKDSLFTGIIALALFGPIVGLRTVAKNEVLVVVLIFFPTGFLGKPDIEKV